MTRSLLLTLAAIAPVVGASRAWAGKAQIEAARECAQLTGMLGADRHAAAQVAPILEERGIGVRKLTLEEAAASWSLLHVKGEPDPTTSLMRLLALKSLLTGPLGKSLSAETKNNLLHHLGSAIRHYAGGPHRALPAPQQRRARPAFSKASVPSHWRRRRYPAYPSGGHHGPAYPSGGHHGRSSRNARGF